MRNPVMAGPRLYIRPTEPEDGAVFSEIDITEDELFVDDGPRYAFSVMASKAWIENFSGEALPERLQFSACLIEDDRCIGFVGLGDIDWIHRSAATSAIFLPGDFRGRGFGTEAKHLLLEYAFEHIGLHTLVSWIWQRNERSVAAILKQGYKPAGMLRFEAIDQGRYYDVLVFDLLREDWLPARDIWQESLAKRASDQPGGS